MAGVFERSDGRRRVEVRQAGSSLRLYVDGVVHTTWTMRHPLTGAIWDALALSGSLAPPATIHTVLLLGVGGGATAQLVRRYLNPARLIGVDIDAELVELGRRWFKLDEAHMELAHADAAKWLASSEPASYDHIIDDLYTVSRGEPVRPDALPPDWWQRVVDRLNPHGVLAVNFGSKEELRSSPLVNDPRLKNRFAGAFGFHYPQFENVVAAFGPHSLTPHAFRRRIMDLVGLSPSQERRFLGFKLRRLWG